MIVYGGNISVHCTPLLSWNQLTGICMLNWNLSDSFSNSLFVLIFISLYAYEPYHNDIYPSLSTDLYETI